MVIFRMKVNPRPDFVEDEELVQQNIIKLCKILSDDWEEEKKIENKITVPDDDNNNNNINIKNDISNYGENTGFGNAIYESSNRTFSYYDYTRNIKYNYERGEYGRERFDIIKNPSFKKNS